MTDSSLVLRRAVAVHNALTAAGIECAIGGALALGYHIDDPRATRDIDVNVSLPKERALQALSALPAEVPWDDASLAATIRDGQVRIMWPVDDAAPLPLDLFFAEHEFHGRLRQRAILVTMRGQPVRILSATDLTIFKTLFDRPKDWVDIQAMLDAHDSSVDLHDAVSWVERIVGPDDPRAARLKGLAGEAG